MKAIITHKKVKSSLLRGYGEQINITYRSLDSNDIEKIRTIISKCICSEAVVDIDLNTEEKVVKSIVGKRKSKTVKKKED